MEIEDTGLFWEVDDKDGGIVKKKKDDILTLRFVILCNIFHNIYFPKKIRNHLKMLQNWRRSDFCQLRGCHGRSRQCLQWKRGIVIPTHASFLKKCFLFQASKKILDLSSVPYADAAGAKALAKWAEKGKKKDEKSLGDR